MDSTDQRILPQRANRGKKIKVEDEADREFWQQEFFQDESEDEEFADSDITDDENLIDSDFDDAEAVDDVDEEEVERMVRREERVSKRKAARGAGVYVDPGMQKEPKEAKPRVKRALTGVTGQLGTSDRPSVRQSTRKTTQATEEMREKRQRVQDAKKARKLAMPQKPVARKLTQQELLAEAVYTERRNLADVEAMTVIRETERKKRQLAKPILIGPRIVTKSTHDGTTITFMGTDIGLPRGKAPRVERRSATCVITGLPAKYVDPLTGKPFANSAAFKAIRSGNL